MNKKIQLSVFFLAVLGLSLIGPNPTLTIIGIMLMLPFAIVRIMLMIKTGQFAL